MDKRKYIKDINGEGYELIMTAGEEESFIGHHLETPRQEIYLLDDGNRATGGDYVVAGINGKFFLNEQSYGKYLIEVTGNEMYMLPHVREERI